jgi:putative DNA primase/helicase
MTSEEIVHEPQYYLERLLCIGGYKQEGGGVVVSTNFFNAFADYWRYYIGVNVIPAVGKPKVPIKGCFWRNYQDTPISEEQHNQWKKDNAFRDGMAVIAGKVYHRKDLVDYYFAAVNADNQLAICELLTRKGNTLSVEQIAQKTIVDQHNDKDRLHFYMYTVGVQLRDKASDKGKLGLSAADSMSKLPAFEVKASSNFLIFPAPCPHKTSGRRSIIGTYTPITLGQLEAAEFQGHIDGICKKYGLDTGNGNGNSNKIPIHDLFKDDFAVYKGHNRHLELMRAMESLMRRNVGILTKEQIWNLSQQWNQIHCEPPLDDVEFRKQWGCAEDFIMMMITTMVTMVMEDFEIEAAATVMVAVKGKRRLNLQR